MAYTKQLVVLVAALLLAVFAVSSVSAALVNLNGIAVEVNGVDVSSGDQIAAFSGDVLPVKVEFTAGQDASDVRIKAWISGGREYSAVTEKFDLVSGSKYGRTLSVQMPTNIDPTEGFVLNVVVENQELTSETTVNLAGQRASYVVKILDVAMDSKVVSGDNLALDIVLKNQGMHSADDTFVQASIPALGVEAKGYFGDLYAVDNTGDDQSDAAERRLVLKVPGSAPAGVYTVEIQAYNGDSVTTTTRKVAVVGAGEDSMAVSSANSKTFAAGEKAVYSLTLVNSGDKIRVYDLVLDTPTGLTVAASDSVVAIPAGSSKTVQLEAVAAKAGKYTFGVNVHSNGNLVKAVSYTADVQGRSIGGNATVLLTVVLAIIFVVLLVVLIVLLTRKPKKSEEFGESYY
jgi:hypothetical protein